MGANLFRTRPLITRTYPFTEVVKRKDDVQDSILGWRFAKCRKAAKQPLKKPTRVVNGIDAVHEAQRTIDTKCVYNLAVIARLFASRHRFGLRFFALGFFFLVLAAHDILLEGFRCTQASV